MKDVRTTRLKQVGFSMRKLAEDLKVPRATLNSWIKLNRAPEWLKAAMSYTGLIPRDFWNDEERRTREAIQAILKQVDPAGLPAPRRERAHQVPSPAQEEHPRSSDRGGENGDDP